MAFYPFGDRGLIAVDNIITGIHFISNTAIKQNDRRYGFLSAPAVISL